MGKMCCAGKKQCNCSRPSKQGKHACACNTTKSSISKKPKKK